MSATTSKPAAAQTVHVSAPLGMLAAVAIAIAFGVVVLLLSQALAAPAAGTISTQAQDAIYELKASEREPLFSAEDSLVIVKRGEIRDMRALYPHEVSGPATGAQKGLAPADDAEEARPNGPARKR